MLIIQGIKKEFIDIRVRSLFNSNRISKTQVLDGVNLELKAGSFTCLTGRNGSGKTTLLRILSGILDPDEGSIKLNNNQVKSLDAAYITRDERSFFWRLSVIENLNYFQKLNNYGKEGKDELKKLEDLLFFFKVNHLKDKKYMNLSSGEKQRVNLCRFFLRDPKVLLFDEVSSSLDSRSLKLLLSMLLEVKKKEKSKIILWVSHNPMEVSELVDSQIDMGEINGR